MVLLAAGLLPVGVVAAVLAAATVGGGDFPVQLAVAIPLAGALAVLVRWLLSRVDRLEADKSALLTTITDRVLPALTETAVAAKAAADSAALVADVARDLRMVSSALSTELALQRQAQGRG